ncbi:MAG TPA: VirB4 family type IV secretion/conjugal transfer ATPase [Xanthobacteraceae bacterium]|jgi:type IV secretion system protein VirB4|nr:VirB4 family type IV secretion/conjugal transfer ATPase [Xanthobacteraceae bacterium]
MIDTPRLIEREETAANHLPYSHHVNERTIVTGDGRLMQFVRVRGLLFETADSEDLNYRTSLRDMMLRSLGSSRYAIYHYIIRRRGGLELGGEFTDSFSTNLDTVWRARQAEKNLFENELIITVVRRPMQGKVGLLQRIKTGGTRRPKSLANVEADLRQLTGAVDGLVSALAAYAPQVLTVRSHGSVHVSEPLGFLSYLANGDERPVQICERGIADYLFTRRVSFGEDMIELGPTGHLASQFVAMVSIKDYPAMTSPGMLDDVLRLPIEMTVSQSFAFVDRKTAVDRMNLVTRRMKSADDEALSLRSELTAAKDDVAAGRAAFAEHHLTFAVRGTSIEQVNAGVAEVSAALSDLGIIAVREEVAMEPAFWAQFPGNFGYIVRRALVSTTNFASLASLHNFASGKRDGNHWGSAVTLLETSSAGPYYFNFHVGDLGNFTVIGPSGSGKTVILNFLLAQARRFDPRIIFFDKDRGAEIFVRAIGGEYNRLHPEARSGFNPLRLPDSPSNRQFLIDWLSLLSGLSGVEDVEQIRDAVDACLTGPVELRRLRHLVALFQGGHRARAGDLYSRLKPWWGDGERAWLFDNADDTTSLEARTIGFDMSAILDDPISRTPAMFYLFHRVEERLDGTPAIILVDEGWKALDDDVFVRRLKDWEKTIRKRNGVVGFATQSAEDALGSRISSAIVEQAATQIFTPNPKARSADYVDGFGLSSHELDIVRSLPEHAHAFLVRQGNESAVVRLDLSGEGDLLTVLSGRERSVRILDEVRGEVGDDPASWMDPLLERVRAA